MTISRAVPASRLARVTSAPHSLLIVAALTVAAAPQRAGVRRPPARTARRPPRPGPLTFDEAKAEGKQVDWGPELRHHRPGKVAVPERLRAAVRRTLEGRRQRRRHRPRRHRRHHHRRPLPGPARPPPAGVLQEHRERREPGQRTRDHAAVRRLLLRALRALRPHGQAGHRQGERRARRRRRRQGRRDQGRHRDPRVRVVRRAGPDHRVRRRARGARRAVRRRLRDRGAAVVPRLARPLRVADDRVARAGERTLGRVRRQAARGAQGHARGRPRVCGPSGACSASCTTTTTRAPSPRASSTSSNASPAYKVKPAVTVPYALDLSTAQQDATNVIAKLKSSGVTSVILAGDPVFPTFLTKEATAQGYFPEWVVLGYAYTDTAVFGRQYDQKQWAHAFGVSLLPARTTDALDELGNLITWQTGQPARGEDVPRAGAGAAPLLHRRAPRRPAPHRADVPRRHCSASRRRPPRHPPACTSRGDVTASGRASTTPAATTPP